MKRFKFSKETLNTSNVDVDPPSTSLLWMASTVYPRRLKIIIRFSVATFKRGFFSALHKFHETTCVSRNSRSSECVSRVRNSRVGVSRELATLEWVVSRRLARGSRLVTLRVDNARICYPEGRSLANLSSRVLTSNKGLPAHRTLHECTSHSRARATLHLSGTVCKVNWYSLYNPMMYIIIVFMQ